MPVSVTDGGTSSSLLSNGASRSALLRRFVEAYWLRPENALWMALRAEALAGCEWIAPSIDISCGDGIFSFLTLGGRLDPDFDVFQSVKTVKGGNAADMFDHVADDYSPPIVKPPVTKISVGSDLKPALLAKAAALGVYESTRRVDNESRLPFDDGSFQTVYCNSAYWVRGIDAFLNELHRICAADGRVILQVKLRSLFDYTLRGYRDLLGRRFLDIIDRGRANSWPTVADEDEWERRFANAGFDVAAKRPFVTATHAHIWDIGLRPIAPMLVRMTDAIAAETRASIKREWTDVMCELLLPFFDSSIDLSANTRPPVEIHYELCRS